MEQVAVTPLGSNLYRLAESPLFLSEELELGTVVEAERDSYPELIRQGALTHWSVSPASSASWRGSGGVLL
jgi:hypothetical protein